MFRNGIFKPNFWTYELEANKQMENSKTLDFSSQKGDLNLLLDTSQKHQHPYFDLTPIISNKPAISNQNYFLVSILYQFIYFFGLARWR